MIGFEHGLIIFFLICLLATPAFANAGLPMIFVGLPLLIVLFIPICLLEIGIFSRTMKLPFKKLVWPVFCANLVSTLVGYPLSWALLLGIHMIATKGRSLGLSNIWNTIASMTLQAAWLVPYEKEFYWMVPIAVLVGFIPAFFLSVWIEGWILKICSPVNMKFKKKDVWNANLLSYGFLVLIVVGWFVFSVIKTFKK